MIVFSKLSQFLDSKDSDCSSKLSCPSHPVPSNYKFSSDPDITLQHVINNQNKHLQIRCSGSCCIPPTTHHHLKYTIVVAQFIHKKCQGSSQIEFRRTTFEIKLTMFDSLFHHWIFKYFTSAEYSLLNFTGCAVCNAHLV